MLEKSATHRKGCIAGVLYALGGPDPLASTRDAAASEGMLVDKEIVRRRYIEDVETCIRIGARDKDIEVRQIAKKCWEIYRTEYSERVARCVTRHRKVDRSFAETSMLCLPEQFRWAADTHRSKVPRTTAYGATTA